MSNLGETRVSYGKRSKCLPECKVGEYSRTGAVPAATAPRDTRQMAPALPPATKIQDLIWSFTKIMRETAPRAPSTSLETKYGSGCRPECRPGSYSSTGLYPCTRCEEGTYTKESGATACTKYPKECSEGYKLTTTEGTMTECKRECAKGYYSKTGVYPARPSAATLPWSAAPRSA